MDVNQVAVPALTNVPGVELLKAGTWAISTGEATFTTEDLRAAVAALECPAVRRPVLKLGHDTPMPGAQDAEPAIGWVANMAVSATGSTLVGDYSGMPGWLGPVLASAYPDRSIEGEWDYRCQKGHTHPFVIHAVALLGVTRPGVGTLGSLQDVASLYGVAAAPANVDSGVGFTLRATLDPKEVRLPNPSARRVAASVNTEDIRRAYYATADMNAWIEEIQFDPPQLIVIDDSTGKRTRVPVTLDAAKEGEDAVAFGEPVEVVIRYEDSTSSVAASATSSRVVYASRQESRPGAAAQTPSPEGNDSTEGHTVDLKDALRTRLGVKDDSATEETLLAALDEALAEQPKPETPPAPTLPEGVVVVDAETLEELRVAARAGQEAANRLRQEDRDRAVDAAVQQGKIARARADHWRRAWDADPEGAKSALASIEPGLVVPVMASGHPGALDETTNDDQVFTSLFGEQRKVAN